MSIDAVFDGDYESAIIFGENIYIKNENRKIRMHFVRIQNAGNAQTFFQLGTKVSREQ
jgi:hypothetical protein